MESSPSVCRIVSLEHCHRTRRPGKCKNYSSQVTPVIPVLELANVLRSDTITNAVILVYSRLDLQHNGKEKG